jgi:macrolide-specific efflux system membrane fusion protein
MSHQLTITDVQVTLISEVRVPAREAGALAELDVVEGQLAQRDETLGRLDSDLATYQHELARIEQQIAEMKSVNDVDLRFARKALAVAQAKLRRSEASNLVYAKTISQTEIEALRLEVEKSELAIEQSQRDLDVAQLTTQSKGQAMLIARKHIDQRRIVSPIPGMVVQVFRKPGEWVNEGEPVLRIIRTDKLRVEAFVDGQRYGANLLDCPVTLSTYLPPGDRQAKFEGRIVFVSPEVQPVNGQVRVWAEVENRDLQLRPGTRGTLEIKVRRAADER